MVVLMLQVLGWYAGIGDAGVGLVWWYWWCRCWGGIVALVVQVLGWYGGIDGENVGWYVVFVVQPLG